MICLICRQAEVVDGLTSVRFAREEIRFVIKNVPANVCPVCGEAFLDKNSTIQLLSYADELSAAGMMDIICEYGE